MSLAASLSTSDKEKGAHETIASELFFPISTCSANVMRIYNPRPSIICHLAIIAMPCALNGFSLAHRADTFRRNTPFLFRSPSLMYARNSQIVLCSRNCCPETMAILPPTGNKGGAASISQQRLASMTPATIYPTCQRRPRIQCLSLEKRSQPLDGPSHCRVQL
jgi:hypothetical protein